MSTRSTAGWLRLSVTCKAGLDLSVQSHETHDAIMGRHILNVMQASHQCRHSQSSTILSP